MTPWPFHTFPVNLRRLGMNLNYRKGTPAKPWISSIEAWKVWVYHGRKYMGRTGDIPFWPVNLDVKYLIWMICTHPMICSWSDFLKPIYMHGSLRKQSMKRSMKRSRSTFHDRDPENWMQEGNCLIHQWNQAGTCGTCDVTSEKRMDVWGAWTTHQTNLDTGSVVQILL